MSTTAEGSFQTPDGFDLYQKTWKPDREVKARILFIHGFSDHVNRYNDFFPVIAAQGVEVVGIDQRGWGKSVKKPKDKGDTGPTSAVLSDLAAFIQSQLPSPVPVFLMGHSMGGGIVLTFASTEQYADLVKQLRGIILESPYITLVPGSEPLAIVEFVGRLVQRVLPRFQYYHPVEAELCTRDPGFVESIKADKLCHGTGTLQMFSEMIDRGAQLDTEKLALCDGSVKSLLLSHGSGDQCTSHGASRRWFERAKIEDKEFKSYDGWSHQLHADLPGNEKIYGNDVAQWVLNRVKAGGLKL